MQYRDNRCSIGTIGVGLQWRPEGVHRGSIWVSCWGWGSDRVHGEVFDEIQVEIVVPIRVIRVIRVVKVIRVIRVIKVIRVIRVIKVIRVNRVIKVIRVNRVIKVIRVNRVIKVIRVIPFIRGYSYY